MKYLRDMAPCAIFAYFVLSAVCIWWFHGVISADTVLIDGGPMLFMDERLIFDGVHNILTASSFSEMMHAVINGDQLYGRTLYYLSALASFIPFKLFGVTGQIVATRLFLSATLLLAYIILVFSFVRPPAMRLLAIAFLLLLPDTSYYAVMPKPEPLQALFLALFLYYFLCRQKFTGWVWIFFGLAFGAKISIIVLLPFLAAYAVFAANLSWRESGKRGGVSALWFLGGFLLSVPIILKGKSGVAKYLAFTFFGTAHGSDNQNVGIGDWLSRIADGLIAPPHLGLLIALVVLIPSMVMTVIVLRRHRLQRRGWRNCLRGAVLDPDLRGATLTGLGLVFFLAITCYVQRIWTFYLHIPFMLMVVGFAASSVVLIKNKGGFRVAGWICATLVALNLFYLAPLSAKNFAIWADRDNEPEHVRQLAIYRSVTAYLASRSHDVGRQLKVAVDPLLYVPETSESAAIEVFWGPFLNWDEKYDSIVLTKIHTPEKPLVLRHTIEDSLLMKERGLYPQHVEMEPDRGCSLQPCYRVVPLDSSAITILERVN